METTAPNLLDVIRNTPERVQFHLSTNDPFSLSAPTVNQLTEATFAGYAARAADFISALRDGFSPSGASREMGAIFRAISTGSAQLIRGWYATFQPAPNVTALVAFDRIDPPINMAQGGRSLRVHASITVVPTDDAQGLRLVASSTALAFFGEAEDMRLQGSDRKLVKELQTVLERIAARDAAIPALSQRSKKSTVPVIPGDNTTLVAAVNAINARVVAMLAAE